MYIYTDVNECINNPCGKNAICTDTSGGFICSCGEGYSGDPYRGCEGIKYALLFTTINVFVFHLF